MWVGMGTKAVGVLLQVCEARYSGCSSKTHSKRYFLFYTHVARNYVDSQVVVFQTRHDMPNAPLVILANNTNEMAKNTSHLVTRSPGSLTSEPRRGRPARRRRQPQTIRSKPHRMRHASCYFHRSCRRSRWRTPAR